MKNYPGHITRLENKCFTSIITYNITPSWFVEEDALLITNEEDMLVFTQYDRLPCKTDYLGATGPLSGNGQAWLYHIYDVNETLTRRLCMPPG